MLNSTPKQGSKGECCEEDARHDNAVAGGQEYVVVEGVFHLHMRNPGIDSS